MAQQVLNTRAMKVTVVLDPAEVAQLVAPDGQPRVAIDVRLPDRLVCADLAAMSVRRALATIAEHGPDAVSVIVQGKLVGESITEASNMAQPEVRPQPAAEAA
jgi:hypothetical protein